MTPEIANLIKANQKRWLAMKVKSSHVSALDKIAARLAAPKAKARYQEIEKATGVPWFIIAVIHEREASQRWDRQLAQGDQLNKVSTHIPRGQGPYFNHADDPPLQDAFYRAALVALNDSAPFAGRWKDWTPGGAMTILEMYNGLGYERRGKPSPYVWSGSDQYVRGKFTSDGHYDANQVDQQEGCAAIIARMMAIDPSIKFA